MSETHDDAPSLDWRKDGRCSACEHFRSDFGEPPDVYGHCKIYPRNGSREATDYACGEYRALPGFSALTQSTSQAAQPRVTASVGGPAIPSGGFSPGRRPVRPGPIAPPHPSVVRRRRVDDDDDDDDDRMVPSRPAERPAAFAGPSSPPATGPRAVTESESTERVARTLFSAADPAPGGGTSPLSGASLDRQTLGAILVDLVEQHIALEEVEIGRKWENGTLILRPGDDDLKEVALPIETFFHKIVMLRDRLRVLEQKINAHPVLADGEKVELQQYISRCYGTLTTFNVLFKHREDRFSSKSDD